MTVDYMDPYYLGWTSHHSKWRSGVVGHLWERAPRLIAAKHRPAFSFPSPAASQLVVRHPAVLKFNLLFAQNLDP